MNPWESDPAFADFKLLAQRLEAAIQKSNEALLKATGLTPENLLPTFAKVQADMLRFDDHARRRLAEALEEKRVHTLAQGNIFVTCVLASAVALSEFKSQPRRATAGLLARRLDYLRDVSTNGVSLGLFAWASLQGVLGLGAWQQFSAWRKRRALIGR